MIEVYLRELRAMVDAAAAADADRMREAMAARSTLDAEQTGLILGTAIRTRLEEQHPDGLDADDIREVITTCLRASLPWVPDVDPDALLIVLAGALGIHPFTSAVDTDDDVPRPSPEAIKLHAVLLLSTLIGPHRTDVHLANALNEIAVAQTMELP